VIDIEQKFVDAENSDEWSFCGDQRCIDRFLETPVRCGDELMSDNYEDGYDTGRACQSGKSTAGCYAALPATIVSRLS